jgi:hypothetical protein
VRPNKFRAVEFRGDDARKPPSYFFTAAFSTD